MSKFILTLIAAVSTSAIACTIFESPFPNDARFAHNVDWYEKFPDVKGVFVLNPAKLKKTGLISNSPVKPAEWVSRYRSFTFSIAGAEIPVDGFNEKGLYMGVLELAQSVYPSANDPRAGVGAGQFVQYNLDTSATIADVATSLKMVRPVSAVKMHFFACDASAKCVVIQYIDGEAKIYRDGDLAYALLTNSPYPQSEAAAGACIANAKKCTQNDFSLTRFATAAEMRSQMKSSASFSDQSIAILDKVAQTGGNGGVTRFQLVYDVTGRTVKVHKRSTPGGVFGELKVDFDGLDCHRPRKVLPVDETTTADLASHWIDLTEALQLDMVTKIGYPAAMATAYAHYPSTVVCQ